MPHETALQLFEQRQVRSLWDADAEKWYISIVDAIAVLTDSPNPQVYWRVLKNRLKKEGNETVTNCNAFKMSAPDGKMRLTDVADAEQLFRLIQSVPSPKTVRSLRQALLPLGMPAKPSKHKPANLSSRA